MDECFQLQTNVPPEKHDNFPLFLGKYRSAIKESKTDYQKLIACAQNEVHRCNRCCQELSVLADGKEGAADCNDRCLKDPLAMPRGQAQPERSKQSIQKWEAALETALKKSSKACRLARAMQARCEGARFSHRQTCCDRHETAAEELQRRIELTQSTMDDISKKVGQATRILGEISADQAEIARDLKALDSPEDLAKGRLHARKNDRTRAEQVRDDAEVTLEAELKSSKMTKQNLESTAGKQLVRHKNLEKKSKGLLQEQSRLSSKLNCDAQCMEHLNDAAENM